MQQSTCIIIISYIAVMVGAIIYMFVIPSNSLDPEPHFNDYDGPVDPMLRASPVKPTQIDWGGVPIKGLEQIPTNTTVYHQSSNGSSFTVGVNNSTSDGNKNKTDRARAELSMQKASDYLKSTTYNVKIDGKPADYKTAHVTQIKSKAEGGAPLLTVSVGNPKGNKNDYGYLSVMKDNNTRYWVTSDGKLSKTFDPKKAVPANQENKVEIDYSNKDTATLSINDKKITTVKNVEDGLLKFGAYAGSSKLDSDGITATFTDINAVAR